MILLRSPVLWILWHAEQRVTILLCVRWCWDSTEQWFVQVFSMVHTDPIYPKIKLSVCPSGRWLQRLLTAHGALSGSHQMGDEGITVPSVPPRNPQQVEPGLKQVQGYFHVGNRWYQPKTSPPYVTGKTRRVHMELLIKLKQLINTFDCNYTQCIITKDTYFL